MTSETAAELRGSVGVWVERQLGARVGEVCFSRMSMSRVWGVLPGDGRRAAVKVLGCGLRVEVALFFSLLFFIFIIFMIFTMIVMIIGAVLSGLVQEVVTVAPIAPCRSADVNHR